MSILKMLPVMLLLPSLIVAGEDDKFRISPEQFKVGCVMSPIANMAIEQGTKLSVSSTPCLPLKANNLYLRHKSKAKEFQWFVGEANAANFKKLYAFNLKENHLMMSEVINMRFYASSKKKAFQDESDIYFDKEFLYSPRLPELYFMKNGKWEVLKKSPFPGMVSIESNIDSLEVASLTIPFDKTPRLIYPLVDGIYAFSFSAPEHLSVVDVGRVKHDEVLEFKVDLPSLAAVKAEETNMTVSLQSVEAANGLEETEVLYDSFIAEVQKNIGKVDTTAFGEIYPPKKDAAQLDLTEDNAQYVAYSLRYNTERQKALNVWRDRRLGNVGAITQAFQEKMDRLQSLPLSKIMQPASVEMVQVTYTVPVVVSSSSVAVASSSSASKDSAVVANSSSTTTVAVSSATSSAAVATGSSSSIVAQDFAEVLAVENKVQSSSSAVATKDSTFQALKLRFGADHDRFDVQWVGTVDSLSLDSLSLWLSSGRSDVLVRLELANDKPVWLFRKGELKGRHQYRFEKIWFVVNEKAYEGKGQFTLPPYIMNEPEVRAWFDSKHLAAVLEVRRDSLDSAAVADSTKAAEPDTMFKAKIIKDKYHGTVAVVDSGEFRYRGKVVRMSPFAIHTTEVTQEFFKDVASRDTSRHLVDKSKFVGPQKPVHNITWNQAQSFCKMLGGDLPSEAQWEFAARAGDNEGAPWMLDEDRDAGKYAVYFSNSYALGKADSAYGPQPVCGKKPNSWGLYDMAGNVAEWTRDKYFALSFVVESSNPTGAKFGTNKVFKGGSWKDKEKKLNMTKKDDEDPRYWSDGLGFRCVFPVERIFGNK